jgi:hypothetical protein
MKSNASFTATTCALICAGGSFISDASEAPDLTPRTVCELAKVGVSNVGKILSIRGILDQDIEFAALFDRRCPLAFIRLKFIPNGPDPISCINDPAAPNCGGLKRNGQIVTVTGVLSDVPSSKAPMHNLPALAGVLEVTKFEDAADRKGQDGT